MQNKNNLISITQWNKLISAVSKNRIDTNQPTDTMYVGSEQLDRNKVNETRYFCYDNYDRHDVPGLDFIISNNTALGKLTVYNGSEQARAPISFEQGKQIAQNLFNDYGSNMAEEIVCDWVMDGNTSTF
jgi:hypothetical protein|tara:strand:+ start:116 stop:502 length:387 start_codon:yes stop_codon:yes gene_type:complete